MSNFIVECEDEKYTTEILDRAEKLYHKLSRQWIGQEYDFPASLRIRSEDYEGKPDSRIRNFGNCRHFVITLNGPINEQLEIQLPHEIAHVITMTKYRNSLPLWLEEGIAILSEQVEVSRFSDKKPDYEFIPFPTFLNQFDYGSDWFHFYYQSKILTEYILQYFNLGTLMLFAIDGVDIGWQFSADHNLKMPIEDLESTIKNRSLRNV